MSHARQQIREAVASRVTGLTTTGSNVHESWVYSHDTLPDLSVYTGREIVLEEGKTLGNRQRIGLEIVIEARAKPAEGEDSYDDQLDTICAEVQTAMAADSDLGGLMELCVYQGMDPDRSGALERPSGIARMLYRGIYRIAANAPQTLVPL